MTKPLINLFLFSCFTLPMTQLKADELPQNSTLEAAQWVCKTSPIWNGRSSYPRFASAPTEEQAREKAKVFCTYSGQASYCESQITCWTQELNAETPRP